jgi:hypothetical protein
MPQVYLASCKVTAFNTAIPTSFSVCYASRKAKIFLSTLYRYINKGSLCYRFSLWNPEWVRLAHPSRGAVDHHETRSWRNRRVFDYNAHSSVGGAITPLSPVHVSGTKTRESWARDQTPRDTDMRRLTTGIGSEKCVVRRSRRCANVIESTYTNVGSIAYYIRRLYGIAYCS